MAGFPSCDDLSDVKPLYKQSGLYLKPLVIINISVQLPKKKLTNQCISNKTLMEDITRWASPDKFCSLNLEKATLEFIRFEGEIEKPGRAKDVLARINGRSVKLPGISEALKVRASIAKSIFPSRHDWDSFFRDAKHMNELKAGERPDTMHISGFPTKWLSSSTDPKKPSESLLVKIFEQFGPVSAVDIPRNDPYRSKMKSNISGIRLFDFDEKSVFEAYIQFKNYISFVNAMDAFRDMKLLKLNESGILTAVLKVDFDKTKHLSEASIRRRKLLREKIMTKEREKEIEEESVKKTEAKKEKEEKDKVEKDKRRAYRKYKKEKRLLLEAQRKLESIRLFDELCRRLIEKRKQLAKNAAKKNRSEASKVRFEDLSDSSESFSSISESPNHRDTILEQSSSRIPKLNSVVKTVSKERAHFGGRGRGHPYNQRYYSRKNNYRPSSYWEDPVTQKLYYRYFQRVARLPVDEYDDDNNKKPETSNSREPGRSWSSSSRSSRSRSRSRSNSWSTSSESSGTRRRKRSSKD